MKAQLQISQSTFLRQTGQLEASGQTIAGVVRDVSQLSEPDRRHLAGMLALERANIALERHETVAAQDWLQDALRAFTLNQDPCGEIDTLNLLGVVTSSLGSSERAREHYTQAVVRSRAIGDGPREGTSLGNLGVLECEAGSFDAGRGLYQAALKVVKSVDDRRMQALMLGRLGLLEHGQGNLLEARGHYDEAIRVAQEVGLKRSESIFRGNLGNLERSEGNYAAAEVLYLEAIHSSRVCGDRRIESLFMGNLGNIAHARGDLDIAGSYYAGALSLAQALSSTRSQALLICSLASLERSRKRPEAARARYNEALQLARESGNHDIEGLVCGNLGELLMDTVQGGRSAELLRQGIQACDVIFPHAAGVFRAYLALALVLVQGQDAAEALRLLDEGERQVANASEEYITFLCVKARVLHHTGDGAVAQQALGAGRRLAARIHLPAGSDLQQQLDSIIKLLALDDASTGA
jgi:tetratricopeptide (TPR) repeat protein